MSFARAFTFILICLASAVSFGLEFEDYFMTVQTVEIGGRPYSVVTLLAKEESQARQDFVPVSPYYDDTEYVRNVIRHVQNWVRDQHVNYKTFEKDSKFYHEFERSESLLDSRSTLIFVSAYNNLADIKATMRITFRGDLPENRLHPTEKTLNYVIPDREYREIVTPNGQIIVEGESVEWKNLIKAPGQEEDFISVLFWRALSGGVFKAGYRHIMWKGVLRPFIPKDIIGECTSRLVNFHTSTWGFNSTYFPEEDLYLLDVPRTVFLQKLKENFRNRGGPGVTDFSQVKQVNFVPAGVANPGRRGCPAKVGGLGTIKFFGENL